MPIRITKRDLVSNVICECCGAYIGSDENPYMLTFANGACYFLCYDCIKELQVKLNIVLNNDEGDMI